MMLTGVDGGPARRFTTAGCLVLLASVAGCGSLAADSGSAVDAAKSFEQALSNGDGLKACSRLTTKAVSALAESEGKPCPRAILTIGLPQSAHQTSADAYGVNAVVRTGTDVLFLTNSTGQWLVTAAGCRRQPDDQPYSCLVAG